MQKIPVTNVISSFALHLSLNFELGRLLIRFAILGGTLRKVSVFTSCDIVLNRTGINIGP